MNAGPAPLPGLVDAFAGIPVTVVGDACLDAWYSGDLRGLSREGAVPVVEVTQESFAPGGAANAARALAALGADVRFVSAVGDDAEGDTVLDLLAAAGVDVSETVTVPGRRTVTKRRVVGRGQLVARFDAGDTTDLGFVEAGEMCAAVLRASRGAAAVLAADYAGGIHTEAVRRAVAAGARSTAALFAVDAHDLQRWSDCAPHLVTPDAEEIERLLGAEEVTAFRRDRVGFVTGHGHLLRSRSGAGGLLATLDGDGAVVVTGRRGGERPVVAHVPVLAVTGASAIGAGDTFVAAALLAMVVDGDHVLAARVGCAAAGVTVRRPGTPVCTDEDLREALVPPTAGERVPARSAAVHHDVLAAEVEQYRRDGRRIVFTNGCFDVLHAGHIGYLEAAKACGDVLVVAVNSDASVRRLKGADRPVNPVEDRVAVLCGLSAVDRVTVFDGDTPVDLLRQLRPDVYVKGGDYTPEMLPEAPVVQELGGEVRIVGYTADRSTTRLIERVRAGRSAG